MANFTDTLIQEYQPIKNNYLKINIPPWRLNFLAQKVWKYYEPQNLNNVYPGKLSEAEWEATQTDFLKLGKDIAVDPEAEIIYNLPSGYVVWLKFTDSAGIERKIDVYINKKDTRGNSNGERYIDSKCPLVKDVRNKILTNSLSPEDLRILQDILGTRPGLGNINSFEKKLQYKLNGTFVEEAFIEAAKELSIKLVELDPFNKYFYKGSPGDIADFDLYLTNVPIRLDIKLIKGNNTSTVERHAHDAQYLVCWNWETREFITVSCKGAKLDLEADPKFIDLREHTRNILINNANQLIRIENIDFKTGNINYTSLK